MKRLTRYAIFAALLAAVACTAEPLREDKPVHGLPSVAEGDHAPGELLVKFVPEMTEILDSYGSVATRSGIPSTDEVLETLGLCTISRVFPVDPRNEERTREAGLHLWYRVVIPEDADVAAAVQRLSLLGEVAKVQANRYIYRSPSSPSAFISCDRAAAMQPEVKSGAVAFNDPDLYRQWHYVNDGSASFATENAPVIAGSDAGCAEAWELCTGDPSIIVAVLDEAIMFKHPDIAANMWVNPKETYGSPEDADGNGYKGDRYGYNFTADTGVLTYGGIYDSGHGTHVGGTIAAVNNNGIGCCGIAGGDGTPESGVKLMSCQVFDNGYTCTVANEARAMKYAADNGAVIIQCSWGYNSSLSNILQGYTPGPATEEEWYSLYPLEKEALDYFLHNAGSPNGVIDGGLAIFASGNEYSAMSSFPAAYKDCISVSAICADFTPASYSNYGAEVQLSAPGGDEEYYCIPGQDDEVYVDGVLVPRGSIWSTMVVGDEPGYGYYDGTSMACPHVSGVAALGLSYAVKLRRHFTADEYKALLLGTARDLDPYMTGEKTYYYNHTSAGFSPTKMNLSAYRGKMGSLVDAGALLKAIGNAGSEMKIPNFYLAPGQERKLDLAKYFIDGEGLTYSAAVENSSVAELSVNGTVLTVRGLKEGVSNAVIKVSGREDVKICVTVRDGNSPSWL